MALTPEDVRNKQFSTVRFKEGYDLDEVDGFLDDVETELTRLLRENEELRNQVAALQQQRAAAPVRPAEPATPPAPAVAPVPVPAAPAVDPTSQMARMLEITSRPSLAA